jgi:hypothetical protein
MTENVHNVVLMFLYSYIYIYTGYFTLMKCTSSDEEIAWLGDELLMVFNTINCFLFFFFKLYLMFFKSIKNGCLYAC